MQMIIFYIKLLTQLNPLCSAAEPNNNKPLAGLTLLAFN